MRRRIRAALMGVAILVQMSVLAGLWVYSQYPLWTGQPVSLAVHPVDPRDLFRGHYLRLDYAIGTVPMPHDGVPRVGRTVHVTLKKQGALWRAGEATYTAPDEGLYLTGRITAVAFDTIDVRYGIEAWFAGPERVNAMGQALRHGGVARIKVTAGGRAVLLGVQPGAY